MKIRSGGVLTPEFEKRVLDGDIRALRPMLRQAVGVNTLDMAFREIELRAKPGSTDELVFTGYACVVDVPYVITDWLGDYTEIMRDGCFTRTLGNKPDVIFCLNHAWDGAPMARTKSGSQRLGADSTGLHVEADLDATRADVHQVRSAMERGDLDAMSFAFWVTEQTWSPDYDQRDIHAVDIDGGDTSVVTWPANPATTGTTALRKRQAASLMRTRIPALIGQRAADETRAGAKLSAATMGVLQEVLGLISEADDAVDAAQPLLADLMGVPNPDADDASDTQTGESESVAASDLPELVRERQLLAARNRA